MTSATFLRHLRRDARGSGGKLFFFVLCLALGVAAVVAVAGFSEGIDRGIRRQARQLLAADLVVSGRSTIPEEVVEAIDAVPGSQRTQVLEMLTLVAVPREATGADERRETADSLLVELKSIDGPYPFYGEVTLGQLAPGAPTDLFTLLDATSTVVAPEVLGRLRVAVGDTLRIGGEDFRIVGTVEREGDRISAGFDLGPRIFVGAAGLERAGLEQTGSRIRYRLLVRLPGSAPSTPAGPDGVDPPDEAAVEGLAERIDEVLGDSIRHRVETWREAQPALRRGLDRSARYLGLAALLSLLLGGVGVAQTVRVWLATRLDAIAVLACLGWRPRQILGLYLAQTTALALLGSVVGVLLAVVVQGLAARLLIGVLPVEHLDPWQPWAVARGLVLGVGVALVFALPPLLAARRVPPIRVLRRDAEPLPPSRRAQWGLGGALVAAVFLLAAGQSASWRDGALFTVGLLVTTGLLAGAARLLVRLARRPRRSSRLELRHALASLERPGSGTLGAVVALGLGVLVVLAMTLVERRLGAQLDQEMPTDAPSAFLIDIQPDQWPGVRETLEAHGGEGIESVPVVMARLTAVDGTPSEELAKRLEEEGEDGRWALRREQRLTYLDTLPDDNRIVAGDLWSRPDVAEVSVEEEYARLLKIGVGSVLRLDIQGVRFDLTVSSLRTVDWGTFGINFYLVVEPGVLEKAPQQRIAVVRLPPDAEQRAQDAVAARFPNVTTIRLREVLTKVGDMLRQLGLGIHVLGVLVVLAGLAILAGAVSAGALRRGREVALYKTLGMTRRQIVVAFALEYALVGFAAGLIGTLAATALAWAVATQGMELDWRFDPLALVLALVGTVALAVAAGLAASIPALRQRPVEVLRSID